MGNIFNGPGSIRAFIADLAATVLFCVCCAGIYLLAWGVM